MSYHYTDWLEKFSVEHQASVQRIFNCLTKNPLTVEQLCDCADLGQTQTRKMLKLLLERKAVEKLGAKSALWKLPFGWSVSQQFLQQKVLTTLKLSPNTEHALSKELKVDKNLLNTTLTAMEKKDLVERTKHKKGEVIWDLSTKMKEIEEALSFAD